MGGLERDGAGLPAIRYAARRQTQIVFADGSIRSIVDSNGDEMINNGFPANGASGFTSDVQEATTYELFGRWQLKID